MTLERRQAAAEFYESVCREAQSAYGQWKKLLGRELTQGRGTSGRQGETIEKGADEYDDGTTGL